MPVAVFSVGCLFKTDKFNWNTMLNMLVVTIGVAIASYGAWGRLAGLNRAGAGLAVRHAQLLAPGPALPRPTSATFLPCILLQAS